MSLTKILRATQSANFRRVSQVLMPLPVCLNPRAIIRLFFRPLGPLKLIGGRFFSSVARLFFSCGPSAIFRGIVPFVVNPIYSKVFWAGGHIRKEVFKGICPAVAHLYASVAVPFVIFMFWVSASLSHLVPDAIKRMPRKSMFSFCHNILLIRGGDNK
jgi:hypothetical protein